MLASDPESLDGGKISESYEGVQGPWGVEVWSQGEELCAVALQEEVFKYFSSLTANETTVCY